MWPWPQPTPRARRPGRRPPASPFRPPDPSSDRLRAELDELTREATDTLATLRITPRRGDLDQLAGQAAPPADLGDRLGAFTEQHG
jgi:hypothetical protein